MYAAHVTASYHGQIVEDRLVLCERTVHIGEGRDVAVAVPGVRIAVVAERNGVCVNGQSVRPSESFRWESDAVTVELSAVPIAALEREPLWNTDVRFPMMMFALLLTMLSLQSLGEVIVAHEDKLPAQLATWIASPSGIQELSTRSNPDFDLGEVGRFGVYREGGSKPVVSRP